MKQILESIGLGDGAGNTSSTRVFLFLILLALLTPKVISAVKSGAPIAFDENDRWIIALVLGTGVGKTLAESKTP